ncbi:RidA family protein [Pseudomonas taiwanensis]|uniref:RidA family protein n=1 Tax=Pseudomonas taiwanensis TaxID=470150 RepID=UPI001644566C|nr:RidA family protein [Pseudomonas taiwanensis]MBC3492443.1 RidA family protein [Pseudomonas taiwanensis]
MIKAINAGPGYPGVSMSIRATDGDPLYLTGHAPVDEAGDVVEGDFESQVVAVFTNLRTTLAAAGVGFEALARMNTYLTDVSPETLATFKKVRNQFVNMECPPANTLLKVAGLYDEKIKIEIDGIAVLPRS